MIDFRIERDGYGILGIEKIGNEVFLVWKYDIKDDYKPFMKLDKENLTNLILDLIKKLSLI